MFLCLCGIISVMMTRVLTGLLTFVVPYSMTGSFVFAFVCLFLDTFCSEKGNVCAIWCAGATSKCQVVFMYNNSKNDNDVLFVCLFVILCEHNHKCMIGLSLVLPAPRNSKRLQTLLLPPLHKIYESPINRAVCQLSSIPGATAQLIACTWATKVFSQS